MLRRDLNTVSAGTRRRSEPLELHTAFMASPGPRGGACRGAMSWCTDSSCSSVLLTTSRFTASTSGSLDLGPALRRLAGVACLLSVGTSSSSDAV